MLERLLHNENIVVFNDKLVISRKPIKYPLILYRLYKKIMIPNEVDFDNLNKYLKHEKE